jgi:ABC-type multidrug transport system fused ATPase/permease subunit
VAGDAGLGRLLRTYVARQWVSLVGLLALLITASAVSLAQPALMAAFLNRAVAGRFGTPLVRLAVAYLVLGGVGQAVSVVDVYLAEHIGLVATNRLRRDLTLHLLQLDLGFHGEHRPGELIQRVDGDVSSLSNFFSRFTVALVGSTFLLAGALAMLVKVDWRVGLWLGFVCTGVGLFVGRYRVVGRRHWAALMETQAQQAGFLEEHLSGTEDLRSCGATGHAMWRFTAISRDLLRRGRRAWFFGNLVGNAASAAFRLGSVGAVAASVWLLHRGELRVGDVYLVFAYTELLANPIQVLNRQVGDLQPAAAAVGRVSALLATTSRLAPADTSVASRLPSGALTVELDDVEFRYDADAERPVLEHVSVRLDPGRVLGLLGRTGSGKSTLAKLVVRFGDADGGVVRIGGIDVRRLPLEELRSRVALVTQDVELFHASARDNLTLFDPSIDDAAIVAALEALGLRGWLDDLPGGLDAVLSAGAAGLSAGEAQLLAFARVFLRNPSVVILDEATARLDPATGRRVEGAIAELLAGRTAIVIAHRLETLRHVDDVLILDDGRVVEHGSRAVLASTSTSRLAELLRVGLDDEARA